MSCSLLSSLDCFGVPFRHSDVAEAVELRQQLEAELLEVGRVEVLETHPVRAASVGLSATVGRVRHVAAKGRSEAARASSVAVVSVLR
jgi:hypothetical protein